MSIDAFRRRVYFIVHVQLSTGFPRYWPDVHDLYTFVSASYPVLPGHVYYERADGRQN